MKNLRIFSSTAATLPRQTDRPARLHLSLTVSTQNQDIASLVALEASVILQTLREERSTTWQVCRAYNISFRICFIIWSAFSCFLKVL